MFDRRSFLGTVAAAGGSLVAGSAAAQTSAQSAQSAPPIAADRPGPARQAPPDAISVLADYMVETPAAAIPRRILDLTQRQLVDTVAVAIAARDEDGVRQLRELHEEIGGTGESAVWGSGLRLPTHDAARINGTMAHALEFDDTFGRGFLHPSAITFPAALAVADLVGGVSGAEFLTATALAVDVACRISIAGQPGVDGFATGWHNTALVGYLSSALLAGRLMGLDRDQLINAAGIACHQAAGNAQSHVDGALTKRLGPGFASSAGIMAARLAARGVTGPHNVLEGEKGWFSQYHRGNYSRALLLQDLGVSFPAEETSFKPWPSCRGSHTSADAALQLVSAHGLRAEDVDRIVLRNGPAEYPFLSTPIESKRHPQSVVEAQFSIPWVVAAAFVDGKMSIAQFTSGALQRRDIHAMAERITPMQDDSLANPRGGPGHAQIDLTLRDGRMLSKRVVAAKGDPEAPLSQEEINAKFLDCVAYAGLSPAQGAAIREVALGIAALDDVSTLSRELMTDT